MDLQPPLPELQALADEMDTYARLLETHARVLRTLAERVRVVVVAAAPTERVEAHIAAAQWETGGLVEVMHARLRALPWQWRARVAWRVAVAIFQILRPG